MGCDIHLYRENLVDGKWVSVDEWEKETFDGVDSYRIDYYKRAYTGRNYNLFGALCSGVRTKHDFSLDPKGLPGDLSGELVREAMDWDCGAHNHSYLTMSELVCFAEKIKNETLTISGMKDNVGLIALYESILSKEDTNWDLIYPFCKWTTCKDSSKFSVEAPADFFIGNCLREIISALKSTAGDSEDQRIVFFFDN